MSPFHCSNEGSNPSGDANQINILDAFLVRVGLFCGARAIYGRTERSWDCDQEARAKVALISMLTVAEVVYTVASRLDVPEVDAPSGCDLVKVGPLSPLILYGI